MKSNEEIIRESDRQLRQELKWAIEDPWLAGIKLMEAQAEAYKQDPKFSQERYDLMKKIIEHSRYYCNITIESNNKCFENSNLPE